MSSVLTWGAGLVGAWLPTFLVVLFTTVLVLNVFGRRPKNFPSGMMILPVVGSLLSMPRGPTMEMLRGLRKKYGDIASFGIFGNRVVVVSSTSLLKEVFALRATADRPEIVFTTVRNRILTDNRISDIGVVGTNGQIWQEQRRFMLHHLRDLGFGKSSYEPVMVEEIAELLDDLEREDGRPLQMKLMGVMFDLFVAGMETTSSSLTTIVHLMTKHPHVQRRVQEELDEVVGRDRLPSFSDMERLPYVQATIHEALRILNLIKLSLPHMTAEDCKLGGYDIPKGTWLMGNLDDAHRNPEYWKNAGTFDPQNFLDENGKFKKNNAFVPFGVGKRVCPGEPLARLELFLFFSHLFQRFTFTLVEEHRPLIETNPMFNTPPDYTARAKYRTK
ncbi:Cytochrome P450 2D15 [Portunus trituberculatus]|uniref:Cytochrome P450 2D15 n=1 Tax=Portunus trituberculatus TaxID=210409 RepID=A0A5B7EFV6_PORTR|nr:Cytochrome P450 2D15 [Portunus trituberculatus]